MKMDILLVILIEQKIMTPEKTSPRGVRKKQKRKLRANREDLNSFDPECFKNRRHVSATKSAIKAFTPCISEKLPSDLRAH